MTTPATAPSNSNGAGENGFVTSIKKGYNDFVASTPVITRSFCLSFPITYLLSYFIDIKSFAASCPIFVMYGLEIHRVLFSILINDSLLGVIFTLISFYRTGCEMEKKIGSVALLVLILTLTVIANTLHVTVMFILSFIISPRLLIDCSRGFWITIFALMVIESMENPDQPRRVFFFNVPARFYPIALLLFFSLFMGFSWSLFAGIATGYLYVNGYLNFAEVSKGGIKYIESWTVMGGLTTATGFISCSNAGSDSLPTNASTGPATSSSSSNSNGWVSRNGGPIRPGTAGGHGDKQAEIPKAATTFTGQGHVLGTTASSIPRPSPAATRVARNTALLSRLDAEANAKFDADTIATMGSGMHLVGNHDVSGKSVLFKYEEELSELLAMGFSREESRQVLTETKGNLAESISRLS